MKKHGFIDYVGMLTFGILEGLRDDQHRKHGSLMVPADASKPVPRFPPE